MDIINLQADRELLRHDCLEISVLAKKIKIFLQIILQLIKKVSHEDSALTEIPNYEKALSSILRDIHICRRYAIFDFIYFIFKLFYKIMYFQNLCLSLMMYPA